MIGRLVQHQQIGREQQHLGQRQARLFTSRKHLHLLVDSLAAEQESAEQRFHFDTHIAGCHIIQSLEHGLFRIEHILLILSIVSDFHLVAQLHLAGMVKHPANNFCQSGFSLAVAAYKSYLLASGNQQIDVVEDVFLAIRLRHMAKLKRYLTRMRRRRELEVHHRLVTVVDFNNIHFFELLHSRLHLFGLGRLITETLDKCFYLLDFALLVVESGLLHVYTLLAALHKLAVGAFVVVNLAARYLDGAYGDMVEKCPVVRHHEDGAVVVLQVAFKPLYRLDVKVVGGLVQ